MKDDIKLAIGDAVLFLNDLDRVLPGKVDGELLTFLNKAVESEWTLDLILNAIANAKQMGLTVRKR